MLTVLRNKKKLFNRPLSSPNFLLIAFSLFIFPFFSLIEGCYFLFFFPLNNSRVWRTFGRQLLLSFAIRKNELWGQLTRNILWLIAILITLFLIILFTVLREIIIGHVCYCIRGETLQIGLNCISKMFKICFKWINIYAGDSS